MSQKTNNKINLFYFSVSKLSHFVFCPKRSKMEIFHRTYGITTKSGISAIKTGNRLHYQYSFPNKSFDRVLIRTKLNNKNKEYTKQVDNIVVIGHYDDLRVLRYNNAKFTSLVELKTTSKKYMWSVEIMAAVKQLQLYMWLMKEQLEKLGFPLWKRSYVEIYSQHTGRLMRRIPVEYDSNIEQWIRHVADCFRGLEKVSIPHIGVCRKCPKNVRDACDWYILMNTKTRKFDM